jgi:maltose alpha-D-glucosyltransferase/alpha-amylase
MHWSGDENAGFSTAPEEDLYLPVNPDPDRPTVSEQDRDPNSLLNRVRALTAIRQRWQALDADANFEVVYAESGKLPFVYTRSKNNQTLMVALNPCNKEVSLELPKTLTDAPPAPVDVPGDANITPSKSGWTLSIGPVSGAIFKIN